VSAKSETAELPGTRPAFQTSLRVLRQSTPFAVLGLCGLFLWPAITALGAVEVHHAWHDIRGANWILAAVLTIISYFAIGQYDVIAHRQFDTGLPMEQARVSGMVGITLSQTIGSDWSRRHWRAGGSCAGSGPVWPRLSPASSR
jgi:uncharacterized membrane protein YbhN (UPF0104 family)